MYKRYPPIPAKTRTETIAMVIINGENVWDEEEGADSDWTVADGFKEAREEVEVDARLEEEVSDKDDNVEEDLEGVEDVELILVCLVVDVI